ncbi:MAG: DNA internalization-related competence protein ComEC/Rec2 [Deltaproteobacteria bacterium]|nr:DNA internalization-related competence protein ComEC/Rec2 [Deltaproteobacteria bacterium]
MKRPLYPALLPSLGFLLGTIFALQAKNLSWPWSVLLLGLSVSVSLRLRREATEVQTASEPQPQGGKSGRLRTTHRQQLAAQCVAFAALGMLSVCLRDAGPGAAETGLDPKRPVTAVVDLEGPWRAGPFGWSVPVRIRELKQGDRLFSWREPLWLRLSGREISPPVAQTLRARGFLGRNRGYLNRPVIPPSPWSLKVKSTRLIEEMNPPGAFMTLSQELRERVSQSLHRASEGNRTSVSLPWVKAMVLGDVGDVPDSHKRTLRRTGLAHLLAVSGLHVGLVALAILVLTHRTSRGIRFGATALGVALYLLLIGPRPAVLRATFMALLALASLLLRRPPAGANGLALFAMAATAWRPRLVLDLGFQLSVAATAGIVLISPWLLRSWGRLPRWLETSLAASFSAQLATLPFSLPAFHLLVPAAFLFNLMALPWAAITLTSFLLWTCLALALPTLAGVLLPVLDLLMMPVIFLQKMPVVSWMVLPTAVGPVAAMGISFAAISALKWPRRGSWILLMLVMVNHCGVSRQNQYPTATLLDVGQGEAILLRDGPRAVLVDGGGWASGDFASRVLLPALAGEGVGALDAVLMTHPDGDHCGGLVGLVDYLPVKELWTAPRFRHSDCAEKISSNGRPMRFLFRGTTLSLGRWSLRVLHPSSSGETASDNEGSVVVRAQVGESCLLLTGDIERRSEAELVRHDPEALRCRFLKIAHHGSKTSSSRAFLEATGSQVALISAGAANVYGHPASVVVDRLRRAQMKVFRTDLHGRVQVEFRSSESGQVSSVAAWPGKE